MGGSSLLRGQKSIALICFWYCLKPQALFMFSISSAFELTSCSIYAFIDFIPIWGNAFWDRIWFGSLGWPKSGTLLPQFKCTVNRLVKILLILWLLLPKCWVYKDVCDFCIERVFSFQSSRNTVLNCLEPYSFRFPFYKNIIKVDCALKLRKESPRFGPS